MTDFMYGRRLRAPAQHLLLIYQIPLYLSSKSAYIMRDSHTISREEGNIMKATKPQIRSSFKAQSREQLSKAVTKKVEKIITDKKKRAS